MKKFLFFVGLLFTLAVHGQDIKVVQINATWNDSNTRTDLENLKGCSYSFGWLEEQTPTIQSKITAVPVVILYKGNIPVKMYTAGISLELNISFEEIQDTIYALKED